VTLEIIGDMLRDTKASDYGFRVYAGVEDPVKAAAGGKSAYGKYLAAAPQAGDDLAWSFFTQRRKDIFDFDETDRGKKAWFCVHLESQSGLQGPWGPLFWTIIP
jgi:hypothetical protein